MWASNGKRELNLVPCKIVYVLMIGDGCKWKQGTGCPSLQQYYDSSFDMGMQQ